MKKLQIKLPLLLPEVPDEKDQCVQKLIQRLEDKDGLEKVHVADETDNGVPQLCFHYDPDLISLDRIRSLAEQAGAEITEKFGHKLIEVYGIRHTRHARHIQRDLQENEGIIEAAVSASGMVRIEYDKTKMDEAEILKILRKEGLDIPDPQVRAERALEKVGKADKIDEKKEEGKKEHEHKEGEDHEHSHGGIFGKNTELIFSITCGAFLATGFGLSYVEAVPSWVSFSLYLSAYFFGGFFTAKEAVQTIAKGGFEIDFLMLVAAIGAAILGEWAEGALLLFLFSLGHALEHYAMSKARKSIAALAELAPKIALLKKNGKTEEVGIEKLSIGDVIVIKPNSKISADGVVLDGQGSVNQAPITGESVPVDKVPVDDPEKDWSQEDDIKDLNRVFSGTNNGNNTLEVKVIKEAELLKIAVAVENLSDHPLAKAVVRDGKERLGNVDIPEANDLEAVLGKGIKASLGDDKVYIGNLELFESLDDKKPSKETEEKVRALESDGNTTMLIRKNETYIGIISLMDTPRKEAKSTLEQLKKMGINRMIMLTGDNQKVADAVAKEIGLTDAWGGLLPEEKVEAIKELRKKESKVAMVGDGVNDAPAMANSTVGIAMGAAGSDVALETADIALMADKLETLPFAIGLSRKAKGIIKQNLWVSLGIVALLIPSTIFGWANIGIAVLIHEGSILIVVFNALRLLAYKK